MTQSDCSWPTPRSLRPGLYRGAGSDTRRSTPGCIAPAPESVGVGGGDSLTFTDVYGGREGRRVHGVEGTRNFPVHVGAEIAVVDRGQPLVGEADALDCDLRPGRPQHLNIGALMDAAEVRHARRQIRVRAQAAGGLTSIPTHTWLGAQTGRPARPRRGNSSPPSSGRSTESDPSNPGRRAQRTGLCPAGPLRPARPKSRAPSS